jgi:hypothetical protein
MEPLVSIHVTYASFIGELKDVCVFIAAMSVLANLLPKSAYFRKWPHAYQLYCFTVDFVAACALNWRVCLPSLDNEWMDFHHTFNRMRRRDDRNTTKDSVRGRTA